MDASQVTAINSPAHWTEAELTAWMTKNASLDSQGIARLKEGLASWVRTATYGLSKAAAQQIHNDIHQGVDEEIARLRQQGLCSEEALRRAVAMLGDPKRAHKSFTYNFLTAAESSRVEQLSRATSVGTTWSILWVIWLVFCLTSERGGSLSVFFLLSPTFNLSDTFKGFVGRLLKISFAMTLSRWLIFYMCIQIAMFGYWILQSLSNFSKIDPSYLLFIAAMFGLGIFAVVEQFRATTRLIRKLENGAV